MSNIIRVPRSTKANSEQMVLSDGDVYMLSDPPPGFKDLHFCIYNANGVEERYTASDDQSPDAAQSVGELPPIGYIYRMVAPTVSANNQTNATHPGPSNWNYTNQSLTPHVDFQNGHDNGVFFNGNVLLINEIKTVGEYWYHFGFRSTRALDTPPVDIVIKKVEILPYNYDTITIPAGEVFEFNEIKMAYCLYNNYAPDNGKYWSNWFIDTTTGTTSYEATPGGGISLQQNVYGGWFRVYVKPKNWTSTTSFNRIRVSYNCSNADGLRIVDYNLKYRLEP